METNPEELFLSLNRDEEYVVFLHSPEKSYLAISKKQEFITDKIESLKEQEDYLFGYISYDVKNSLENLPLDEEYNLKIPNIWFVSFETVLIFDNKNKTVELIGKEPNLTPNTNIKHNVKISNFTSNMTKKEYISKVDEIKRKIEEGIVYQANLTRKFHGNINNDIDKFQLFIDLYKISPSKYNAFIKFKDLFILSSSPEQFLYIKDGIAETNPIKGSLKRTGSNDQKEREILFTSEKDRSENLMITDLMRNDFAIGAIPGSVNVPRLFEITSYNTIHHMSSCIKAHLKENITYLKFMANAFPPGSMTGAPKIEAIKLCSYLEKHKRGIYSGALGFFNKNELNFSVVIRTLILKNNYFEFQVGGAIIYDSIPEEEYEETIAKAKAIMKLLNISEEQIRKL